MIKVVKKKTLNGKIIKSYELNQGNSFRFKAFAKKPIGLELIKNITFKLSDKNYNQIFEKNYIQADEYNWYLNVEAAETNNWPITKTSNTCDRSDSLKTEILVEYIDGQIDTVEEAYLDVSPQIKKEEDENGI